MKKLNHKTKRFLAMFLAMCMLAGQAVYQSGQQNAAYAAEPETQKNEQNADDTQSQIHIKDILGTDLQSEIEKNVMVSDQQSETEDAGIADRQSEEDAAAVSGRQSELRSAVKSGDLFSSDVSGGMSQGNAYTLQDGLIDYTARTVFIRQYANETAGGIYFLRNRELSFLDLSTGQVNSVYTFPSSGYVYETDGMLYWSGNGTIIVYDLNEQTEARTLELDGITSSSGIGVDAQGRIYLSVRVDGVYYINLYTADGELLDSTEMDGVIYEFSGFGVDGEFYYIGYYNWVYWGYDHDMKTLFCGKVSDNKFDYIIDEYYFGRISNQCQLYYYEYQDCAAVLNGEYLTDKLGNVYDISRGVGEISYILSVPHEYDEELTSDWYDPSAIGTRMLYQEESSTLIAYASGNLIYEYDLTTGEQLRLYQTDHFVFNLLQYGDSIIAIEKENDTYYLEWFSTDDFYSMETVTVNLNETDTYASHTEEEVHRRWEQGFITSDTQVYASDYSLNPYREAIFSDEMQTGLLNYSNYMRWLGGLTPFASAEESVWDDAGKGAVLLTALNEMTHSPSQPEDMDDAYYQSGYDACSNSNLYSTGISSPQRAMDLIVGWTDDTANVSNLQLGHRFTFLQRAGYQIAYGSAGYTLQTVEAYNNQFNTTGTINGVDNNDYAYTWPGAGAFPTDAISTDALWSVNLNSDLIDLSNLSSTVTIEDLDTGEIYDVTDSLGSSAYYGFNDYFGYFYGECFYFSPPEASSYEGKEYKVTFSNLQLSNGQPAELVYTVSFFTPEHNWGDWETDESGTIIQRVCEDCGETETGTYYKGDIDMDGNINVTDLMMCLHHVSGRTILSAQGQVNADIDGNGLINVSDLMRLLHYVSGRSSTL